MRLIKLNTKNNNPMSSVEGSKIKGKRKTDNTITTTKRMHTSGPSDRSARVNNRRVLEDFEVPKKLNETDTEVLNIVFPSKEDSVL